MFRLCCVISAKSIGKLKHKHLTHPEGFNYVCTFTDYFTKFVVYQIFIQSKVNLQVMLPNALRNSRAEN